MQEQIFRNLLNFPLNEHIFSSTFFYRHTTFPLPPVCNTNFYVKYDGPKIEITITLFLCTENCISPIPVISHSKAKFSKQCNYCLKRSLNIVNTMSMLAFCYLHFHSDCCHNNSSNNK